MPKVSIILPTFNGERFLSNSIESIISQTYKDWELIIVNDCSTDNTANIINHFIQKDTRIKVITNKENKKLPASLNIGFEQASGEYYTWTSDDNEYYPQAIETMVEFLDNNKNYGMVYATCKTFDTNKQKYALWGDLAITPNLLLETNVIGACFMYKKAIADIVGKYDEKSFLAEDHDYWLRIYKTTDIAHLTEELYLYRYHEKSLTTCRHKEAHFLSKKLALKHYKDYVEKFKAYSNIINEYWFLIDSIVNKNINNYNSICYKYRKSYLYQQLKEIYLLNNSKWILNRILQLGERYILRGLCLMLRGK